MESWIIIAFIAPALWSIVNLIDVYFVDGVYSDEYDGTIISGLLQLLPWVAVISGFWDFTLPNNGFWPLFLSGAFFICANFFYFRALFKKNDASLVQILWNGTIPLTLFFSWLILRDNLSVQVYLGMLLVLIGATTLNFSRKMEKLQLQGLLLPMLGANIFLALSFTCSEYGYHLVDASFFDGYLVFTLGAAVASIYFFFRRMSEVGGLLTRITTMSRQYIVIFLIAEILAVLGTFTSQLAIDKSPSAALVATIESLIPVFVMVFSLAIVVTLSIVGKSETHFRFVYQTQFSAVMRKSIAVVVIACGIYLMSS